MFVVNDLVTKYKLQKVGSAKRRCFSNEGQKLMEAVTAASDDGIYAVEKFMLYSRISFFFPSDLPKALEVIQERLRKKEEVRIDCQNPLVLVVGMLRPAVLYV